ncbi:uncharacterized protein LOC129568794 [Sitodiplosis mosellana]|uniref:uncharacterized protein LOC129568794 n=1 Tax=Sitodiplosis mosellana TaxID=263140 RepID=UPI002443918D|nr:uncharacterized protein LOC129568794 [Sitodiplosis mosellana]
MNVEIDQVFFSIFMSINFNQVSHVRSRQMLDISVNMVRTRSMSAEEDSLSLTNSISSRSSRETSRPRNCFKQIFQRSSTNKRPLSLSIGPTETSEILPMENQPPPQPPTPPPMEIQLPPRTRIISRVFRWIGFICAKIPIAFGMLGGCYALYQIYETIGESQMEKLECKIQCIPSIESSHWHRHNNRLHERWVLEKCGTIRIVLEYLNGIFANKLFRDNRNQFDKFQHVSLVSMCLNISVNLN